MNEHFAEAHNNLGNLLRQEGQLTDARIHLARAIALKPDYADALSNWKALTGGEATPAATAARKPPAKVPPATATDTETAAKKVKAKRSVGTRSAAKVKVAP